jgi:hypothetical protein
MNAILSLFLDLSTVKEIPVKLNLFDRAVLTLAVLFLGVVALRPLFTPEVARAQGPHTRFYFEPGIRPILSPDRTRQIRGGKIVVDLTNGNIWGFPTADDVPYPVDNLNPKPAISTPIYLGKFDLAATLKNQ